MSSTKLLYMDGFDILTCDGVVTMVTEDEGVLDIVLDQTCFYPKGGGQDHDTGTIRSNAVELTIERVYLDEDGVVHHQGKAPADLLAVGSEVQCSVDSERRALNTRLHSAGHLVDMAIDELRPEWVPGKGAHYPDMSFVEYTGEINIEAERDSLIEDLEVKLTQLVSSGATNSQRLADRSELETLCRHVPEYLPDNKPSRVVMYGDFGVPCGGTHVSELSEVGTVKIRKIKQKNGLIRVSYILG